MIRGRDSATCSLKVVLYMQILPRHFQWKWQKMYCISYLSSCFINIYFLYSYCKKSSCYLYYDSLFIMWSHTLFHRIKPVCSQSLCLFRTYSSPLLQDGVFKCVVVVLPSPLHPMVLLVFVLDGVTELRMKGFSFGSGLWHACFCCNSSNLHSEQTSRWFEQHWNHSAVLYLTR